jgi:SAM-dependent methyltransferase
MMTYHDLLDRTMAYSTVPPLYAPGEKDFWADAHISSSMLKLHLDPTNDLASRRLCTIDRTVSYWLANGLIKPGMNVLDLGCGPGLYAERLGQAGVSVVGLDISPRSLAYASEQATTAQLPIEYHCMDFLTMDYTAVFDVVIQVYGELCVFSDEQRDDLLRRIHTALKKDGLFIFDVSTRKLRMHAGLRNRWYVSEGGFWRPGKHVVLEQGFDYPADSVWLDQYIVIDNTRTAVYRNWFHDYALDALKCALMAAKFNTCYVWNDLTGSAFDADGDWIAVAAQKVS